MAEDTSSPQRSTAPVQGGTVEPASRAKAAIQRYQIREDTAGERYELRDPFAEVTYRAKTYPEMVAKAEQLGSSRFVAVSDDGKRTTIQKVDGQWVREGQPDTVRAEAPRIAVQSNTAQSKSPRAKDAPEAQNAAKAAPQAEAVDPKALAKIEAQAERTAMVARLEAALRERYVIKRAPVALGDVTLGRTEYRFRGDTSRVAFTESTFRLATDTNSPSVARSMVDVAEARNWKGLRVSGSEDFKRLVWLEASVRGVKTLGYEPNPGDLEVLKREREARMVNRIEPERSTSNGATASPVEKPSARGAGGRKAVLSALEAVLVAKGVHEAKRAAVIAAATEKLAERSRNGQVPKVKVYDKAAPAPRAAPAPTAEQSRTREPPSPAPVR